MSISLFDFLLKRKHQPIVDVRSPAEFAEGHIKNAINIPLLNNEERIVVGTAYKQQGQQQAIREGFRLVGPRLKEIISEAEQVAGGKEILVYCWRGGMRSGNFCKFIEMAGIKSQPLQGGYKAYRNSALESFRKNYPLLLLTGFTGSGKSEILRALKESGEQIIDLEFLAHHKGSAFGGLLMPNQPTTEQFQNKLFEELLTMNLNRRIWVEDESLAIGKIFLPIDFWNGMKGKPIVRLDLSKPQRVQRLVQEYGSADRWEFLDIMGKITKRLGGQHYNAAKSKLLEGDMTSVIDILLTYYDKAYEESIEKRAENIALIIEWNGVDKDDLVAQLIKH